MSSMKVIQRQIDAFFMKATIIKADMRRHVDGMLIVDQVNESLIFSVESVLTNPSIPA